MATSPLMVSKLFCCSIDETAPARNYRYQGVPALWILGKPIELRSSCPSGVHFLVCIFTDTPFYPDVLQQVDQLVLLSRDVVSRYDLVSWLVQQVFCLLYVVILVQHHHGYPFVWGQYHSGVIFSQFFHCLLFSVDIGSRGVCFL